MFLLHHGYRMGGPPEGGVELCRTKASGFESGLLVQRDPKM